MNVILSHVAKHYAYEAAFALQEAKWLKRFYTSFYDETNPSTKHRLLRSFMPESLRKKLNNRYYRDLDETRINSFYFPEILERTPLRNLAGSYNMMNLKGELYDRRVASQNLECDIFHGFEGAAMHSFRKAKKQGAKTVLDYPILHYHTIREIMREEYQRFNIDMPAYLLKDDVNIRRKQREIEEADYLFVPTKKIAEDFIRRGKKENQVKDILYGIDLSKFSISEKKDKTFRVLFVGSVGFRKGVYYLLEAFKELKLKQSELLLVGQVEVDFKSTLGKYEGIFKHLPSVTYSALPELYQSASVFVFPSLVEGSALVTFEAMASGIPVIVSENAGSIARDGVDGFVLPIRSKLLKDRILQLYECRDMIAKMSYAAATYAKLFTWENYREKFRETYATIL